MDALPAFNAWLKITKAVMPVMVLEDEAKAVPLAKALTSGGVHLLEVTLRTKAAWSSIEQILTQVPNAIVGAGTVMHEDEVGRLAELGAKFIVSPGFSDKLAEACQFHKIPYLPGVATATEIMQAVDAGFNLLKLFPAKVVGGVDALKAFSGPFAQVRFCPTGGISRSDYSDYLALPNVSCVGGSWLSPQDLLNDNNWDAIKQLALVL